MTLLRPMMGNRRRAAIDRALVGYQAPIRKLNFGLAEEIRERHWNGETVASLARSFGVAWHTIEGILEYRI